MISQLIQTIFIHSGIGQMQPSESAPSEVEVEKTEPVSRAWCFDSVFAQDYELRYSYP
jgi:hypothetical protein